MSNQGAGYVATAWALLMETRLHPDAPFGVVSSHWTIAVTLFNKSKEGADREAVEDIEMHLKLIDFGDKAVSEMPDAK